MLQQQVTHLFDFGSSEGSVRCDRLLQPEIFFEDRLPLAFIGFVFTVELEKAPYDAPAHLLLLCEVLHRHAPRTDLLGAFRVQTLHQLFQFLHVGLFAQARGSRVFPIAIAILLGAFCGREFCVAFGQFGVLLCLRVTRNRLVLLRARTTTDGFDVGTLARHGWQRQ